MLFLAALLSGKYQNGHTLLQVQQLFQSASAPDCPVPFDFIGRVEDFSAGWAALAAALGCSPSGLPYNRSFGHHQLKHTISNGANTPASLSEADPFGTARAIRAALYDQASQPLLRAVCWFLLPDYAIFRYQLPDVCTAAEPMLRKSLELAQEEYV